MLHRVRAPDISPRGAAVDDVRRAEVALEDLLVDLLVRTKDVLQADTAAILLLDEETNELVARAASGLEEEVERGIRIPVGKGFAGRVAAARSPVVIEDVDHSNVLNPLLREKGIKSLLGVPLEVEDKLLGVLHIGSLRPRIFTSADIETLRRVARRVALPIAQSELYGAERGAREQLEAVRRQLAFLADASAVLASSLDYETTLASVARLAVPELADWCVIDVLASDGSVRRVAAVCADPAKDALAEELLHSYPERPEREEGTSKVLRTGQSELVEEVTPEWLGAIAPDERQRDILTSLGIRSNILVPLLARGRTLGVLTLATAESGRTYDEAELRLAEELAARAALAVDNALLFRDAEESLGLLDALFATAPVGLAFFDRELRYLKVNDALAAMHGRDPEEHIGQRVADVVPDLAEEVEHYLRTVLETGKPVLDQEVRHGARGLSEVRFWLANYYPVRTTKRETIGVGAVMADMTERNRAERRLATQYEVTRILSTARSLEQAIPQVLCAMCENLDWELGDFWTIDERHGCLVVLDQWHVPTLEPGPFATMTRELRLKRGEGLPGRVWESGQPHWVRDLSKDANLPRTRAAETIGLRSAFAFPAVLGSSVLGVVAFFSGDRKEPDPELLAMTAAVGSQIGQFIERKRAEQEGESARERLAFLAEASRVLGASLDYEETLHGIAKLAVPAVADWCAVELVGEDGKLDLVALTHVDEEKVAWAVELAKQYPPDPNAPQGTYAVLRSGEPLLMQDIPDELLVTIAKDDQHLRLLRGLGVRSWIAAPMRARDRSIGVLSLITTDPDSGRIYGDEDLAFAVELARRAAVAVENAHLFKVALQNEQQQRFLAEAGNALASSLDFHTTLQQVARLAVPAFADWCIVDLVDGAEIQRVAVAAAREESQRALEELRRDYQPTLDSPQPAAQALRGERPVIFYEFTPESLAATSRDERHLQLMQRLDPCSAIAVPLVARGHTVGAITFAWAESGRRYTDADLPLAEEIARRAALAVDNARLHRETEERARAALVLSHVGDGVFMTDRESIIRLWNTAAEAVTGLPADEVVGRLAEDVIPGWHELAALIPVADAPAPAASRAETLPVEIGGRELWLSITGVGLEEGTVYAFRDLTEERALDKMRSDFVATISHELRTPLASVYGAAVTLIERESELDREQRTRLLGIIAGEADRLARIVNDILLASRLDSQTVVFSIESCDALESLEAAVEAARMNLPPHLELELEELEERPAVAADPEKLRQILGNLIDNAIKYSPGGGIVRVGAERRARRLRFSVSDEGIGIPSEERERIFEKFYRLDPELLQGVGGTGLGLYISRELARRMGGSIWVEPGRATGSTFHFELPLAELPAELGFRSEVPA